MENRLVCQRVLPTLYRDAGVHRLAPFFRWLRSALQAVAPADVEDPRIVVLSPGPYNDTAFEHAVLASTLGYPLVEAPTSPSAAARCGCGRSASASPST
jgi:uncharacterized circularly permuted ATP-grasp superfamily protein